MGIFKWLFSKKRGTAASSTPTRSEAAQPRNANPADHSGPTVIWRAGSFPMDVVGESHYQAVLSAICGGHNRDGHELEIDAELVREPQNPHDPNAVKVTINRRKVGYLPREQAKRVGYEMTYNGLMTATCRAKVKGGWRTNQYDEGSFGVRLAVPNSGAIDFGNGMVRSPEEVRAGGSEFGKRKQASRPVAAPQGPLAGQRIAIMGARDDGPEAIQLAKSGAKIVANVGKKTTILVVIGDEPFSIGVRGSRSFQAAEEMIAAGSSIRIVSWASAQKLIADSSGQKRDTPAL